MRREDRGMICRFLLGRFYEVVYCLIDELIWIGKFLWGFGVGTYIVDLRWGPGQRGVGRLRLRFLGGLARWILCPRGEGGVNRRNVLA